MNILIEGEGQVGAVRLHLAEILESPKEESFNLLGKVIKQDYGCPLTVLASFQ